MLRKFDAELSIRSGRHSVFNAALILQVVFRSLPFETSKQFGSHFSFFLRDASNSSVQKHSPPRLPRGPKPSGSSVCLLSPPRKSTHSSNFVRPVLRKKVFRSLCFLRTVSVSTLNQRKKLSFRFNFLVSKAQKHLKTVTKSENLKRRKRECLSTLSSDRRGRRRCKFALSRLHFQRN